MKKSGSALVLVFLCLGCAAPRLLAGPLPAAAATVELIESSPIETELDHADLRDAKDVWPEMLSAARSTIDLSQYYVSSAPRSALEPVLRALEEAAARGVRVRLLIDNKVVAASRQELARLSAHGATIRYLKLGPPFGGTLHAKYFIVDQREAFVGSHNFDWRALSHLHELGVRLRSRELATALDELFAADWTLAEGDAARFAPPRPSPVSKSAIALQEQGQPLRVALGYSPKGLLPDESLWELPRLVEWIDQAQSTVRVQLYLYRETRSGAADSPMARLDAALRRASARGVRVELLLGALDLGSEAAPRQPPLPGVAVKLVTIPRWSGGEIPDARQIHAKYMVVDGKRVWIGTSNWEDGYFTHSRNISVFIDSARLGARLDRFFADLWQVPYARPLAALPTAPTGPAGP